MEREILVEEEEEERGSMERLEERKVNAAPSSFTPSFSSLLSDSPYPHTLLIAPLFIFLTLFLLLPLTFFSFFISHILSLSLSLPPGNPTHPKRSQSCPGGPSWPTGSLHPFVSTFPSGVVVGEVGLRRQENYC